MKGEKLKVKRKRRKKLKKLWKSQELFNISSTSSVTTNISPIPTESKNSDKETLSHLETAIPASDNDDEEIIPASTSQLKLQISTF